MWTVTYAQVATSGPPPYTLSEPDRNGRVLVRHSEPLDIGVIRATQAGLLVTRPGKAEGRAFFGSTETLALLDPATGQIVRELSDGVFAVLDATDDLVAWSSARGPLVEVYDLHRMTFRGVFHAPGYQGPNYGRFSPDSRALVLGFSGLPQLDTNPETYGYLQVLDLVSSRIMPINGLHTTPKADAQLDWSRDGGTVLLAIDDGDRARVVFWGLRSHAITTLPKAVQRSPETRFLFLQRGSS